MTQQEAIIYKAYVDKLKKNSIEYWQARCVNLEISIDYSYVKKTRDQSREMYIMLAKK